MERYHLISHLGSGAYGSVNKAINRTNNEVVAIKRLTQKYDSEDESMRLPELQSLLGLNDHPNVVKLKEFIYENNEFFFVFEHMDYNLHQLIIKHFIEDKVFSEIKVRKWMFQVLEALKYMHRVGYIHRDLKPENLLVSNDVIKIADFGMAREMASNLPFSSNVTTRFYCAPEVLLQPNNYGAPSDMWAVGAIMAELYTLSRLFRSTSELGHLHQICTVLGAPTEQTWLDGVTIAASLGIQFPVVSPPIPPSELIPNASLEAIDLILAMCSWDPSRRPTASNALQHPFFQGLQKQSEPLALSRQGSQFNLQQSESAMMKPEIHSTVDMELESLASIRNFSLQQRALLV